MQIAHAFPRSPLRAWLGAVLAFAAGHAQALCWIEAEQPRTANNMFAVTAPQAAALRQTIRRVHAIVKGNAAMHSLEETRLRSRWNLGIGNAPHHPANTAWYQTRDHRRSMWTGECGVLEAADRLPPYASVMVTVNRTSGLFNGEPEFDDEGLRAWREPPVAGQAQGRPLYFGWQLVFSKTGRVPWVPVSNAEFLDFAEREYARQIAATAGGNAWAVDQREAMRRYRAALAPSQLAAQARGGFLWQHPGVPPERYPLLVKIDPDFPWDRQDRNKPQILTLSIQGAEQHAEAMQRVLQTLDLAAFEALVRPH